MLPADDYTTHEFSRRHGTRSTRNDAWLNFTPEILHPNSIDQGFIDTAASLSFTTASLSATIPFMYWCCSWSDIFRDTRGKYLYPYCLIGFVFSRLAMNSLGIRFRCAEDDTILTDFLGSNSGGCPVKAGIIILTCNAHISVGARPI